MKIFIDESYETVCNEVLKDVVELMASGGSLICTASGDSPSGLYKQMVNEVKNNHLDVSHWRFISLDEWVGLNGDDEGSCRFHLNNQLFSLLKVPADNICFFDGKVRDLHGECEQAENFIEQHYGINVAIVGIGLNGHVGMNEPGTLPSLRSHVTALHPMTLKIGQKYFKEQQPLSYGITLGLANLMEARHIILIVSGKHKAEIVKKMLEGEISQQLPASLLRNHPDLRIYLDREAASMIQPQLKHA